MWCITVDAEHPCGRISQSWHVATRNGLVVLHRINLGRNARSVPRGSFVIGPLNGHTEECVHVEFHDATGPRVNVDVRVIRISDGQEGVVDVFTRVVQGLKHSNQVA